MAFSPRYENLVEIYENSVKDFAGRELFGTKRGGSWQWMTYGDFGKEVDRFRGGLASLGIGKGDVVAIIANNRIEWAVAAYATYGLGAAFVPMYEQQHVKDWEYIVKDCEAKVLIVANDTIADKTRALLDSAPSLKHIIRVDAGPNGVDAGDKRVTTYKSLVDSGKEAPLVKPAKDDLAGLIYTSGTTGNPKGVILTHFNLASNISAVLEISPVVKEDRSLSFLPWAHSFGQTGELHSLFASGASMALCEAVDKILDNLAEVRPTLLYSVPRIFNKLYAAVQKQISSKPAPVQSLVKAGLRASAKERRGERLTVTEHLLLSLADRLVFAKVRARFGGRLRFCSSGGAALSREVAEFIDSLGIVVYEGYGLTETSPVVSTNWPGERRIGSVGRAIPGVRIEIDPAHGERKPAENGKPDRLEGEVIVYGPNVMKGYFKRDDESAQVFTKDGGFRTGDMGYLDAAGFLYLTGRIKEQYKLENGKYVVPTPLEEALKLSSYVANVMVYGDNRPFNVALVVASMPQVREWAQKNGVAAADDEQLLANDRVRQLFRKEVEEQSKAFKGFESVQDFALISNDFTTENGMLTPSLKVKRRKVLEVYGKLLDELYTKKRPEKKAQPAQAAS